MMGNEKRLIDANALTEEIERVYSDHYERSYEQSIHDLFNAVRRRIRRCPTVDAVEVVHGRWVLKPHDGAFGVFHLWHCSVCDTIRARQDPYCGECGAKMDGGADNV